MTTCEQWWAWRRDVFGDPYMVWHEGPDFSQLLELAQADLMRVGGMLTAGIRAGDAVAVESFVALAGAGLVPDGAEALLKAAVAGGRGTFLVRLAEALYVLSSDESWAEPIVAVLTNRALTVVGMPAGEHWGDRIDAAMALTRFTPTEHLVEALAQAVTDQEYLVRHHAANTLLHYAGVAKEVSDISEIFTKVTSETDRTAWRAAADQLAAMALRFTG